MPVSLQTYECKNSEIKCWQTLFSLTEIEVKQEEFHFKYHYVKSILAISL